MGMSLDAFLVFGIDIGGSEEGWLEGLPWINEDYDEDDDDDDDDDDDFQEWYYEQLGISNKELWDELYAAHDDEYISQDKIKEYEEKHPEWRKSLDELYEKQEKANKDVPFEFESYGVSDFLSEILHVKGTLITSGFGIEEVDPSELVVDEEALKKTVEFCEKWGIPFENPKWILAGRYW